MQAIGTRTISSERIVTNSDRQRTRDCGKPGGEPSTLPTSGLVRMQSSSARELPGFRLGFLAPLGAEPPAMDLGACDSR